ncbi:MAG: hypothetical protein HY812_09770 [Planctomycetes bacterium]|nr:hypothetical protein [Planctomycetota bacterium]
MAVPVAGLALAGALWESGRVTLPLPRARPAALPAPEQARRAGDDYLVVTRRNVANLEAALARNNK